MDARIDGRPVTPRAGFPVEIEALWINGLGSAADLLGRVGQDVHAWSALREQAMSSFGTRFGLGASGLAAELVRIRAQNRSVRKAHDDCPAT